MAAQVASRRGSTGHQPALRTIQTASSSNNLNTSQQRLLMGHPQQQPSQQDRIPTASPRYNPARNSNYKTQLTNPFVDTEYRLPQPQPQQGLQPRRHRRSCSMTDFVPDLIIPDTYAQTPSPVQDPFVANGASGSIPDIYSPNYSPGPVSAPCALPFSPTETIPEIRTKASTPPPVTSSKAVPPRRGRHVRRSSWSGNRPIAFDEPAEVESFDLLVNSGFQTATTDNGAFSSAQETSNTAALLGNRKSFDSDSPFLVASSPRSQGDIVGRRVPIGYPTPSISSRKSGFSTPRIAATSADADADSDDEFVELYGNARRHRAEAARALNALEKLVSTSTTNIRAATAASPTKCSNDNGVIRSSSGTKIRSLVPLSPTSSPTASSAAGDKKRFSQDRNPPGRSPMSSRICRTIFGQGSARNLTHATDAAALVPSRSTSTQPAPSMKSAMPNREGTLPFGMPSSKAAPPNSQSAAMIKSPTCMTGRPEKAAPSPNFLTNANVTCDSPFARGGSLTTGDDRLQRRRSHDDGIRLSPKVCDTRVLRRVSFSSDVEFITERE